MPKMATTEPSVDEVKMKKGGKMQYGGSPMMGRASMMGSRGAMEPMQRAALLSKKGGEVESKATHMSEMKKIGKVEKELKSHESKSASKGHKGLKKGGSTGGIEVSKYKTGGSALAAKGSAFQARSALKPKIDVQDKVVSATKNKAMGSKTGALELSKFKKGGTVSQNVAGKYLNNMNGAQNTSVKKSKTGALELSKYKAGGHVAMTCKNEGGYTQMKKMAKC